MTAMRKKSDKKNKGSALLIAIVIMMVVMMLSLALLLASYSLTSTAARQRETEQCTEAARSLGRELKKEITRDPFDSYAEQEAADKAGTAPLWFYLRYNVWQSSWPYYNPDEPRHGEKYAFRYFKFNQKIKGVDDISVLMYWESENEAAKGETTLSVRVTCWKGRQKSVITSTYNLLIEDFKEGSAVGDPDHTGIGEGDIVPESSYNPNKNRIYEAEKWKWY